MKKFMLAQCPWMIVIVILVAKISSAAPVFPPDNSPWQKASPESQGMSTELLKQAPSKMTIKNGSVVISSIPVGTAILIRNGFEVYCYGDPYGSQSGWASATRSIRSSLYGMLIHDGVIKGGSDAVERPVNQLNSPKAQKFGDNTLLKHLISFTSCSNPPGTGWSYACNQFSIEWILGDLTGQWLSTKAMAQMGTAVGGTWDYSKFTEDPYSPERPFVSLKATPADAARWGWLWINKGNWNGKQVVDSWFVERSVKPLLMPDGKSYVHNNEGWCIHLNYSGMWGDKVPHDAYAALGAGGSMIFVCPSLQMVFARKGKHHYEKTYRNGEQTRDIRGMMEPIIAAITDSVVDPVQATEIVFPSDTDTLKAGQTYTLIGKGENLKWSYDANSDGKDEIEIGTGDTVSFTVPTDVTGPMVLELTLTGDFGVVVQYYQIKAVAGTRIPAPAKQRLVIHSVRSANGQVQFGLHLPRTGSFDFQVFETRGRMLCRNSSSSTEFSNGMLLWHTSDSMPRGVLTAKLQQGSQTAIRRFLLVP